MDLSKIETEGRRLKYELFKKFAQIKEGHPGSVLSIFDVVTVMYLCDFITIDPSARLTDTFIMSKGHAAAAQYPFLVKLGILDQVHWDEWGVDDNSCLRVFGNKNIPGIDVTSGSLGHGLGIAAGMALADRLDGNSDRHYVVISEGELYEGSTWEALLFIAHNNLTQVKIILDVNRNMILGRPEELLGLDPIAAKFESFGFEVFRINGHELEQIYSGFEFLNEQSAQPKIVIADTVKGKGVSFLEDTAESHYWGAFTQAQISTMLEDLKP